MSKSKTWPQAWRLSVFWDLAKCWEQIRNGPQLPLLFHAAHLIVIKALFRKIQRSASDGKQIALSLYTILSMTRMIMPAEKPEGLIRSRVSLFESLVGGSFAGRGEVASCQGSKRGDIDPLRYRSRREWVCKHLPWNGEDLLTFPEIAYIHLCAVAGSATQLLEIPIRHISASCWYIFCWILFIWTFI